VELSTPREGFDELLTRGASPLLDALDPYGITTLPQADLAALAAEVDAVLSMIPEHDRVYEDA
jgi:hypothetical protein